MRPPSTRLRRARTLRRSLMAIAIAASTLLVVVGPAEPVTASTDAFATPVFSTDARGDITTIGNITTSCDSGYTNEHWSAQESMAACIGAVTGGTGIKRHDGAGMPPINNRLSMVDVDVDADPTTFNSSSARLQIPADAVVLWAGLHWNAAVEVPAAPALYGSTHMVPPRQVGDRYRVRFATPASNGYLPLDASSDDGTTTGTWGLTDPGGTTSYAGFVDVTDHVAAGGSGHYWVADIQSCLGFGGCFGSWSLTVAFAHQDEPPRNLNVWHGWKLTTPTIDRGAQEFTVEGLTPPPSGPVHARIGVVQADGDRGLGPDSLDISSPSNPTWRTFQTIDRPFSPGDDDWFNSTVNVYGQRRPDTDATPNLLTNLHQDIALVEDDQVIGNTDTSFSFRVQTAGTETLYSQVVHSAVDLYAPEIAVAKTVDPAGPVRSGDEVTWTLTVENVGIDPIRDAVVTDPLPPGLAFVPGSITYLDGGPPSILGPKTDAPGDDEAEFDPDTRTLTFRVGTGATESEGGLLDIAPAPDGSDRLTISFRTIVELEPDRALTNEASAEGRGRALSDPFGPIDTHDADEADLATLADDPPPPEPEAEPEPEPSADLGITKTDDDAVIGAVGDRYAYRFEVTNVGPDPATGVTILDELDPRLRYVGSGDGCSADDQLVTCLVGDLDVGATAGRSFEVEVVELPEPGEEIVNLATVHGDQPDPDCVPETPTARCNHAEEATPRIEDERPDPEDPPATSAPPTSEVKVLKAPDPAPPAAPWPPAPPRSPARSVLPRTGWSALRMVAVGATLIGLGAWVLERSEQRRLAR